MSRNCSRSKINISSKFTFDLMIGGKPLIEVVEKVFGLWPLALDEDFSIPLFLCMFCFVFGIIDDVSVEMYFSIFFLRISFSLSARSANNFFQPDFLDGCG